MFWDPWFPPSARSSRSIFPDAPTARPPWPSLPGCLVCWLSWSRRRPKPSEEPAAKKRTPELLSGLVAKTIRRRQRTRLAIAGLVLGASAASVGLTVAVTAPATPTAQATAQTQVPAAARLNFQAAGRQPADRHRFHHRTAVGNPGRLAMQLRALPRRLSVPVRHR